MKRTRTFILLFVAVLVLAVLGLGDATTRSAEPGGGGMEFDSIACSADIDEDGSVGFSDLLILLGQWGPCCDPTGVWQSSPTSSYTCAFGLVNFSISTWTITADSEGLTVLGAPATMTGPPVACAAGNEFTVSGTVGGTCVETYTLTGTFTGENAFDGTFVADYQGSCFDCVQQSFAVTATR